MKWLKSLDKSLFGWGSPVTFGVVRIVTAGLALVNFLMVAVDFDAWFTERGFTPLWHAVKWGSLGREPWWGGEVPRVNLLANVTDVRVTAAVYILCCVACFTTMIGLWTRLSSILMFVFMVSLHHRAPDILHSGDTLLRQMTILVMLAPSGAACSLDRLFALWRGRAALEPAQVSLWPQRLMQYQVTVVYFTTAWHKATGSHWRDGTATWFVPQLHEFDRFPVPAFFDQQPFVAITTYSTLLIELAVAFLAYAKPLRMWVLLAGVALHAGIEYRFNIPLFSFVMCSTYLAFFDGEEYSAFAKKVGQKWKSARLLVLTPRGTGLSPRGRVVLNALDVFKLLEFETGESDQWVARNSRGPVKNPLLAALMRCPGAWALLVAPGLWKRLMSKTLTPFVSQNPALATAETVQS